MSSQIMFKPNRIEGIIHGKQCMSRNIMNKQNMIYGINNRKYDLIYGR